MLKGILSKAIKRVSFEYYKARYLRGASLGQGISIHPPFYFENAKNVVFRGVFCHIGPQSYIVAKGGVEIGENVILGPRVSIWTYSHDYQSPESVPYGGEDVLEKVVIEDNVWIGYGALILPGTHLGKGCVVGAGAVVKGKFESCSVIVGNPAKVVRVTDPERYNALVEADRLYLKLKEARKNG